MDGKWRNSAYATDLLDDERIEEASLLVIDWALEESYDTEGKSIDHNTMRS